MGRKVLDIFHSLAYEDGTDSEFRNVDNWNSDAGELPKKNTLHLEHGESLKTRIR